VAIKVAGEADERAAKAIKRAAEIEKIAAWRRVSSAQYEQISDGIRGVAASLDLLIEFQNSDPEAFTFAREIANIFVASGVGKIRMTGNAYLSGTVFGLHMAAAPEIDATSISNVFSSAGIELPMFEKDLTSHLSRHEVAPSLYIFVASKPPLPHVAMATGAATGTSNAAAISTTTRELSI
jgi:hypothetical protein